MKKSQSTIAVLESARMQIKLYRCLLATSYARKDLSITSHLISQLESVLSALIYVLIYDEYTPYDNFSAVSRYFDKVKKHMRENYL